MSNTKLFSYGSKILLPIKGSFYSNILFHDRIDYAKFYVISDKNKQENLLGIDSATSLGILKILHSIANKKNVNSNNAIETNLVSDILNEYESIFHGIGKMKDVKVKLANDESITLVAQKHRCIPVHLPDKVDNEFKRLFDAGIIEPVNYTSECVSPVVVVPKINSDEIILCVDMTQANKAIKQVRHVIPTSHEL